MFKKMFGALERYFFTGFFILIPVFMTLLVMIFLVNYIDSLLIPQKIDQWIGFHIPGLGVIFVIVLSIVTGAIGGNYLGRKFIELNDRWIVKLPVGGAIYLGTKKLLNAVRMKDKGAFRKVVFVEFPRKGMYSVGFVTGESTPKLSAALGKSHIHVFVPTTPNPTSGFFLMVDPSEVIDAHLTVPEGFSLIISAGIVTSDKVPA